MKNRYSLDNICELIIDCEHKTAPIQETGYPSIRTPNIGRGRLILEGVNRVSEDTYKMWTRRAIPQENDLILAREAPIGNVAIIPKGQKVCLGQRTVLIRPNQRVVNPNYLLYLLLGDEIQNIISSLSNGATVHHLNMSDIRNLVLPTLPPLPTQHKIASILSSYDDLIENNTKRIKILEEMAQTIYNEWFVQFKFPGHENVKMVDSELGMIPEGWEAATLGMVASVIPGYAFKSKDWTDSGVPVIKIKNIWPNNLVDTDKVDHVPEGILSLKHKKYWLYNGDILIAMTGATAGKVGKLRSTKPLLLNQRVAKIEPKQDFKEFVWCTVRTPSAEERFYSLADGAAQPNMSGSQIENSKVIVPSTELVQRFNELVSPLINHVDNMIMRNQNLRTTRDLLLPRLISGEVDISELDINVEEITA